MIANSANAASLAVHVQNLNKVYSDGLFRRRRFQALTDVSLEVQAGEVFGLLGPNGAGKTTLLKILLGIIRKTSGQATLWGLPAGSRAVRRHVGYLPEHLRMPGHHTVLSALQLYGQLSNLSPREIRKRQDEVIDLVGLQGRHKESIRKFSKGMLQRLGLAQALLVRPKLLILDEPTDGLDPRGRAEIRGLIMRLKGDGVTIFVNSHILQEVELVCDRIAILDRGVLRYCGDVKQTGDAVTGPRTEFPVELIVAGEEGGLRRALKGETIVSENRLPDGTWDLKLRVADQNAIDAMVDRLRGQSCSILSLKRTRASLEESFLAILAQSSQGPELGLRN